MRFAYDLCENEHRVLSTVFIDIPKTFPKNHLNALFSAVETLKDGKVYDDRYELHVREDIPSPKICIMTNLEPDFTCLTQDRWVFLTVRLDGSVVRSLAPRIGILEEERQKRMQRHREAQRKYQAKKIEYDSISQFNIWHC